MFRDTVATEGADILNVSPEPPEHFHSFNYKNKLKTISDCAMGFIVELHSLSNCSRSDVKRVRQFVEKLILEPVVDFIEECLQMVSIQDIEISNVFRDVKNMFGNIKSEYKLEEAMRENDLIGHTEEFCVENHPNSKGIVMPMEFQVKQFFERNNYLDGVLVHMREIEKKRNMVLKLYSRRTMDPKKKFVPW